jgi:hypothetical protein
VEAQRQKERKKGVPERHGGKKEMEELERTAERGATGQSKKV